MNDRRETVQQGVRARVDPSLWQDISYTAWRRTMPVAGGEQPRLAVEPHRIG